jgi:hypothetical protein
MRRTSQEGDQDQDHDRDHDHDHHRRHRHHHHHHHHAMNDGPRLNADEVARCHRAKMELQELSEGDHIGRSFHWSCDHRSPAAADDQIKELHDLIHLQLHPKLAKYV